MKRRTAFFAECVAVAKKNGYDGFSSDEELRGSASEKSWGVILHALFLDCFPADVGLCF